MIEQYFGLQKMQQLKKLLQESNRLGLRDVADDESQQLTG